MIGDEPHSEDYTNYRTSANVHCVLFREEQAAYLAGYAAVREGNTSMAVLGGEPLPSTVRYATGFVQGAEAAADSMGVQVYIRIWYSNMTASDDDLTDYVCGWYNEGFQVVMAATPELADSCIQAAEKSGREVIATGWDCAGQSSSVITSAVNCYSTVVQNEPVRHAEQLGPGPQRPDRDPWHRSGCRRPCHAGMAAEDLYRRGIS